METEREDRETGPSPIYEVEFVLKKVQYEALVAPDGKLIKISQIDAGLSGPAAAFVLLLHAAAGRQRSSLFTLVL